MTFYGQTITWHDSPDETSRVATDGCDSPEQALHEAMKAALLFGYTRPRWWQYWRWSESRFPESVILEAEAANLKEKK